MAVDLETCRWVLANRGCARARLVIEVLLVGPGHRDASARFVDAPPMVAPGSVHDGNPFRLVTHEAT